MSHTTEQLLATLSNQIKNAQVLVEKIKASDDPELDGLLFPHSKIKRRNYQGDVDIWRQSSEPHEDEFGILRFFQDEQGEILDIGANSGYSVLSIRCFNKQAKIISFEPLITLEPYLAYIKWMEREKFSYHLVGAGAESDRMKIYAPVLHDEMVTPLARVNLDEFTNPYVLIQPYSAYNVFHGDLSFAAFDIQIKPIDEYQYNPFFIKADVEGYEYEAFMGLKNTIQSNKPLILLEGANRLANLNEFMYSIGYKFGYYESEKIALTDELVNNANGFYLHQDRMDEYQQKGMLL